MNIVFLIMGFILGFGVAKLLSILKKKKVSNVGGGGQPGYNTPNTNDNQTT